MRETYIAKFNGIILRLYIWSNINLSLIKRGRGTLRCLALPAVPNGNGISLWYRYPLAFCGEPPLLYANFILIKAKMGKPDRKISVSVSLPLGEGAEVRGG